MYSLLLAFQWRLWSKCMPYGFDHFKKTRTVLLQARFWAEGKHYVILKTTSQGSGGECEASAIIFPTLQMAVEGSERLSGLPEVHDLEGC